MGSQARRGTRIGRVDDFTEVGRLRDHRWKGIVIWTRKVYDLNGVCTASEYYVLCNIKNVMG